MAEASVRRHWRTRRFIKGGEARSRARRAHPRNASVAWSERELRRRNSPRDGRARRRVGPSLVYAAALKMALTVSMYEDAPRVFNTTARTSSGNSATDTRCGRDDEKALIARSTS